MRLQLLLPLLAPFALIALYHHIKYATLQEPSLGNVHRARSRARSAAPGRWRATTLEGDNTDSVSSSQLSDVAAAAAAAAGGGGGGGASADGDDEGHYGGKEAAVSQQLPTVEARARPAAAEGAEATTVATATAAAEVATTTPTTTATTMAASERDVSIDYPDPVLSQKRLLDNSDNWLPVADAEAEAPSDLAWRRKIPAACKPAPGLYDGLPPDAGPKAGTLPAGCVCPSGRRPYHTILTAQASTYQRWQTLIFYHHFRKAQRANPCTEMLGFTRLLASANGGGDDLMDYMPTVTVSQLGFDKTRGFQVINRPWTMREFLKMKEWGERITEDYVYIAETDHLLLADIPNRATPKLNVAFFFPYMSPVPAEQASVVKRYFSGDHLRVQPVGPSPAIVHVESLKKLTPLWYDLSVDLKHDPQADRAFGWVLEMWGYSIACARVGVKHYVWQQFQIEPSSTWHQNVTAEDPYIYHYTFGVEYSSDGIPVVGSVGEWSLDKRHYFGAAPPRNLDAPPECAQECAWVWWRMFNEATKALGDKYPAQTGGNTRSFQHDRSGGGGGGGGAGGAAPELASSLPRSGAWLIDKQHKPFHFHVGGRLSSPWGAGKWEALGEARAKLHICGSSIELAFDSASAPTSFSVDGGGGLGARLRGPALITKGGELWSALESAEATAKEWDAAVAATHTGARRLIGTGPWAWAGISTMAFYDRGKLVTPWGVGHWYPSKEEDDVVSLVFAGATHRITTFPCHKFASVRESDGQKVDGWIQLGQPAGRACPRGGGFFG